ncbi:MAG: MATE family efflux transporter [Gemmatimonadaceae bacterium]
MSESTAAAAATAPDAPLPGFWDAVREAVRGTHDHDYTAGPIGRSILLLAVPMVLEMCMESVFAVVDVFYVAHLGADAVATVGLTESMLAIVYTLGMGLAIPVSATVARRIGEKDPEGAAHAAAQGILLCVLISVVLGVLGITLAPRLLALMGASPGVIASGSNYTRVLLGGNLSVLMLFLVNAIFRGAGDAAIAMRTLWLANWINILLAPVLVFGPGRLPALGVAGAAIATTIGRGTGALYALARLGRGRGRVSVEPRHFALDPALMMRMIRMSGSVTFQIFVGTTSWIGLVRIVSAFGSSVLAGYTIGMRVVMFALLPAFGMSNAAATMVGQSLGAGDPRRAERAVWQAGRYNLYFLGGVGVLFLAFAPFIVRLFTQDPAVAPWGVACLRTVALGFPFYAYGMVLGQSFNGAGDTWTPTWLNFICFWLFEIPLAWLLASHLDVGPRGAFVAVTAAFSLLAFLSGVLFRRGAWKAKKI